ncbi:MAG: M3 family oligoendopeptidase [Candidatus Sumerlaeaceae bacterium]
MDLFDGLRKKPEFPRHYLPTHAQLDTWEKMQPYFDELERRELGSGPEVEQWLLDLSELRAAVDEEETVRYIRMTCHTDVPEFERAYLEFVEDIRPNIERATFALNRKYVACEHRHALPRERYFVYDRAREMEVRLYREENLALKVEDEKLSQRYQKLYGEMTAVLDGKELTLPQLHKLLEEPARDLRRSAWCAAVGRQLRAREEIETLFDEMIRLRTQIARNAGYANFLEFQFANLGRFDYTPQHCVAFHEAIEKHIVPLVRQLRQHRRKRMGLARLAPWDLAADPLGRPPLRPFETVDQLIEGTNAIFRAVHPFFEQQFAVLRRKHLLDLDSRKGKAPGGYQSTLEELRLPFIFMNAAGRNRDVFTLLHEGGHAFHALSTRTEPLLAYRHAPIEFCEVASMGMEMMSCERLQAFYTAQDATRARREHLEEVLELLPWIARVDTFQHWLYTHPEHTRTERAQAWLALDERFGDELEWSEYPEWRECSWIAKLHFFCVPLYYIEYGIAQLGALQLWQNFLSNDQVAIANYRTALALGGSRPLPELFRAAGLHFAFDAQTIAPLAKLVRTTLEKIPE